MFKKFVLCLLSAITINAHAIEDLSSQIYNIDLDPSLIIVTNELFPENQIINPAMVNTELNNTFKITQSTDLSVTFISEGAGFLNSFGYFTYDDSGPILDSATIFANASAIGSGGLLTTGDTVDLGLFDTGTNIGFWVTANGYNQPNGNTYYSIDHLNPDNERHIAMYFDETSGQVVIGFEDLYNLGDADYNDLLYTLSTSGGRLDPSKIDISMIPSGAPEASDFMTASIGLSILAAKLFALRRRKKTV